MARPTSTGRSRWSTVALPVAVVGMWIGFYAWQAGPLLVPEPPPREEQRRLLVLARSQFLVPDAAPGVPDMSIRADVRGAIVSVYFPGTPHVPIAAWADVEHGDVAAAVAQAARDAGREWARRQRSGLGQERVRVDLTGPERRIHAISHDPGGALWLLWRLVPTHDAVLDPGVDGLVARDGVRVWFSGPSTRVERSQTAADATSALAKISGGRSLRRFRAVSFLEGPAGDPRPVVRGNVLPPYPASATALRQASALGGHYLAGKVESSGRFVYLFEAQEGRAEGDYNLVRHAGTVWAMFQVHRATAEPGVREAAERALRYLGREYSWRDPRHAAAIFLRDGREGMPKTGDVTLGACALGVLAYVEAERSGVMLSQEDRALLAGLGHAILTMQKPDGELTALFTVEGRLPDRRRSIYFPGEATLALAELYNRDGNRVWLDAAKRAADFQIGPRWTYAGVEVLTPPDAWLTQALEKLWVATKEDRYRNYAYKFADEILRTTFPSTASVPPDLRGATFTGEKAVRVTPTSARNEGVVAAARLAREAGDLVRSTRYLEAARAAAWFVIAQQFRPDNVHFIRSPGQALGGIRESIVDNSVRIDGVQHAVSGLLGLADLLEPRPDATGTAGGPS